MIDHDDHEIEHEIEASVIPVSERQVVKDDDPRDIRATGFENLTKEERQEMARRSHSMRRAKRQAAQLAQIQVFTQAHRELASQILGTKMTLLDGLVDEMRDPVTDKLDTSRLDDRRLKVLMALIKQIEDRAFGGPVTKSETTSTVDIRAALVDLTKSLQRPDTV